VKFTKIPTAKSVIPGNSRRESLGWQIPRNSRTGIPSGPVCSRNTNNNNNNNNTKSSLHTAYFKSLEATSATYTTQLTGASLTRNPSWHQS